MIDADAIAGAAIVYLEGYLCIHAPRGSEGRQDRAWRRRKVAPRWPMLLRDRYRAEFLDLIRNGTVDNVRQRARIAPLRDRRFDAAVNALQRRAAGRDHPQREGLPGGDARQTDAVQAAPVSVVDATGLADLFAAGFGRALAWGRPPYFGAAGRHGGGR